MRYRKNDPEHNVLVAVSRWVKANGGKLLVIGGIGLMDEGPSHLFLGTQIDNLRDMANKGRYACGEKKVRSAKLTEAKVIRIIKECRTGKLHEEIAKKYGVFQTTVSAIFRGVLWKHIDRKKI